MVALIGESNPSQANWYSGNSPHHHGSRAVEPFYSRVRDTFSNLQDSRENRESRPKDKSVDHEFFRPSVMDFVEQTNNLPKMFFLIKRTRTTRPEKDSYISALEHSRFPCERLKDPSDCVDHVFEKFSPLRHQKVPARFQQYKKNPSSFVLPGPSFQQDDEAPQKFLSNAPDVIKLFVRLTQV